MENNKQTYFMAVLSLLSMSFLIYIGSSWLKGVKLDVTEEGKYTLSEGTVSIIEKLDSPIKLKLYYSKTAANKGSEGLRQFNNHFRYVNELLKEFVSISKNNLKHEVIDPRPDTPEEEAALAFGLKQFQLTDTERYFFGLVAENESGTERIIEFFDPGKRDKLEYDLVKLIYTVLNPQKKTLGVLSSLPIMNDEFSPQMAQIMRMQGKQSSGSWAFVNIIKDFFEVKNISIDSNEISGIDVLVIIHPKGFPEPMLFAVDQYLLKGGKLLVLVDSNTVSDAEMASSGSVSASPDSGFRKLMSKWGIEAVEGSFAGDKNLSGTGQFSPNQPPGRLLALLQCNDLCSAEHNDAVSAGLNKTMFVFPGVLKEKKVEGVEVSKVLSTSEKGNSYKASGYELFNPQALWNKFSEGSNAVAIGMKSVGKFKTAFPGGKKESPGVGKQKDNKETELKALSESEKESAVIVFSDVDFIADQFAFQRSFLGLSLANDNYHLFLNAVEALSGDVDLMAVRSRKKINRGFDVIEKIEFDAEKKTKDKVKQINSSISSVQKELNDLGRKANEGNIALLQNEGLKKKKNLAKQIAKLKSELRVVKREGREKIELIGKRFQYLNTLFMPALIILFALVYSGIRKKRMRGGRA